MLWMFKALAAKLDGNKWKIPVNNLAEVVDKSIYRSGEPSFEALSQMKSKFKLKQVIDLRILTPEEVKARRAMCDGLGIHYTHIPMNEFEDISLDAVRRAVGIVAWPGNHPILVHCRGGVHRTGLVILAFRLWRMKWTWDEAYDEAKKRHFYSGNGHEGVYRTMRRAAGFPVS